MSGVEIKLVLEILHYVPQDRQIVMIGLNDKEYSPEIKTCLAERNIEVALIEQSNVRDAVTDLRKLDLDIAFYCSPFWGHFMSRIALICAARVSLVQIAFFGDVVTTGLSSCDYFVLPSTLDNDSIRQGFTEKVLIVPNTLMSLFALKPPIAQAPPRKDSSTVVYFSNAHMWKLNGDLIDAWAQILSKVDRAIIRLAPLKSSYQNSYLPVLRDLITKKSKKWAISASRFEIVPDTGADQIQKRLMNSDVYLDSFPYTGSTSLLEALVAYLPVVSLTGLSYPESLSKVMLAEFGLDKNALVLSKDAYVAKAVALGQDAALRKETSVKIKMKIVKSTEQLNKRQVLMHFWNEIDKLAPHRM